jgi:hypothetical protein
MTNHEEYDADDHEHIDPGWIKKSAELWEFTGEKGQENPYKETDEMTDEEYAKHEEYLQQMERDEIKRLKKMGCLPDDPSKTTTSLSSTNIGFITSTRITLSVQNKNWIYYYWISHHHLFLQSVENTLGS